MGNGRVDPSRSAEQEQMLDVVQRLRAVPWRGWIQTAPRRTR